MIKSTTYYTDGIEYRTYKLVRGGVVKILVKRAGVPFQVVRFYKLTGKMIPINHNT